MEVSKVEEVLTGKWGPEHPEVQQVATERVMHWEHQYTVGDGEAWSEVMSKRAQEEGDKNQ